MDKYKTFDVKPICSNRYSLNCLSNCLEMFLHVFCRWVEYPIRITNLQRKVKNVFPSSAQNKVSK